MKILYCHVGVEGKNGWGRSFYLAAGLAELNHEVFLITTSNKKGFFPRKIKLLKGVKILSFPDILPNKLVSTGFGFVSLLYKILFSLCNKFDLVVSDCGHRPSSIPGFISGFRKETIHITEWWDYFGEGGYFERKPWYFKITYGFFERRLELSTKRWADGVVVLSDWMRKKALSHGINKVKIIHGGCIEKEIIYNKLNADSRKLNLCYIGISKSEFEFIKPILKVFQISKIKEKFNLICFGEKIDEEFKKEKGLDDNFFIEKGWINYEDGIDAVSEVDIFLMIRKPDKNALAGWPNKLGDYLAFGKPIIINTYGDVKIFVGNFPEGFIEVEYSEDSLFLELNKVLDGNYDLLKMGRFNLNLSKKLSWKSKASELIEFYNYLFETK